MHTHRILRRILTAALGLAVIVGGGLTAGTAATLTAAPTAANAASTTGGPITRAEVISRAKDWYNDRDTLVYSQTGRHPDDPEQRMELWLAVKARQAVAARNGATR